MAVAVDDVWECGVEWRNDAETGVIVFHKQVSDVIEFDDNLFGQQLAESLNTLGTVATLAQMGNDTFVVCATARRVGPAEPTRIFTDFAGQTKVVSMEEPVPAQDSVLFSSYPDAGAEIASGRSFIPFLAVGSQVTGAIKSSIETLLKSDFAAFLFDDLAIPLFGTLKPVLYRKATMVLPAVIDAITDFVLRPMLASQRRRTVHHQTFSS